jgi:hypothetical protein
MSPRFHNKLSWRGLGRVGADEDGGYCSRHRKRSARRALLRCTSTQVDVTNVNHSHHQSACACLMCSALIHLNHLGLLRVSQHQCQYPPGRSAGRHALRDRRRSLRRDVPGKLPRRRRSSQCLWRPFERESAISSGTSTR